MGVPLAPFRRSLTDPKGIILKLVAAACIVVTIWTAPNNHSRLTAFATLTIVCIISYLMCSRYARKRQAEETAIIDRVEESITLIAGVVDKLQANPATSVEGQMALDGLRNIWGDEADRWFGRSGLN